MRAGSVGVIGNREYNAGWHTALDLPHLLTVAEAITRAAVERRESRGAHFREDYLAKDEGLGQVSLLVRKLGDGSMQVVREPISELTPELAKVVDDNK